MDQPLRFPVLLIALLGLMLYRYAPVVDYGFVYEDHNGGVLTPRALSLQLASRELSTASVALSLRAFGPNPRHFHAENVVLHTINGLLLYTIAWRLFGSTAALVSTGLFWLHPIQTESVAYLSSRSELLMACGILLTLVCLLSRSRFVATIGTFLIGLVTLCTKEAAIGLVALVPLLCWWTKTVSWKQWAPIVTGWKVLALIAVVSNASAWALWGWVQAPGYGLHVAQQVAALVYLMWMWLGALCFLPVGFTVDHDFGAISPLTALIACVLTLSLIIALYRTRRTYPTLAFAGAWVLLAMLPRILLPSTQGFTEFLTEHHFLVPSIGLSLATGSIFREGVA